MSNINELLREIADNYYKGDGLNLAKLAELQNMVASENVRFVSFYDTVHDMELYLANSGYSLGLLEKIKFNFSGNDRTKINAFIAAMKGNIDEYYVAIGAYSSVLAQQDEKYKVPVENCINCLTQRGYSRGEIEKAFIDYSFKGNFSLGNSINVQLDSELVPLYNQENVDEMMSNPEIAKAFNSLREAAGISYMENSRIESINNTMPSLEEELSTSNSLDNNVINPSVDTVANEQRILNPFDSNYHPEIIHPINHSTMDELDVFNSNYFDANRDNPLEGTEKSLVGVIADNVKAATSNFREAMGNIRPVKIIQKVKRRILQNDNIQLKKKMLESFRNLAQKLGDNINAKIEVYNEPDVNDLVALDAPGMHR